MTKNKDINTGFTLIELLVVIAIIAIIDAILFPVFAKVREKARQTTCTSNMKQLGLAFAQYADDYDEKFPVTYSGTGPGWAGAVFPYVKSNGIFVCPDETTTPQVNPYTHVTLEPVSYGYNSSIGTNTYTGIGIGGSLATFTAPASTVLLYEVTEALKPAALSDYNVADLSTALEKGGQLTSNPFDYVYSPAGVGLQGFNEADSTIRLASSYMGGAGLGFARLTYFSTLYYIGPNGRHTNGSNFLAADGHVKWLNGSRVSNGQCYTSSASGFTPNTPTGNEDQDGANSVQAAGTESSQGWTLTFSPI